jgi:hypothetical protein
MPLAVQDFKWAALAVPSLALFDHRSGKEAPH